jgi:hypothetical protein
MTMTARNILLFCALTALSTSAAIASASADTLLIQRVQQSHAVMPTHGMSMAQVKVQFGEPANTLDARGGQKKQWPTIQRWVYPAFTVYFEKNRVINTVLNQATPDEIGPKPPHR